MRVEFASTLVLLVLTTSAALTQAQRSVRGRCNRRAMQCQQQNPGLFSSMDESHDLESACHVLRVTQSCLGDCFRQIMRGDTTRIGMIAMLDHVCEEDNAEALGEASQADCFEGDDVDERFQERTQECVQDSSSSIQSRIMVAMMSGITDMNAIMCPIVDDLMECIHGKVAEMCGAEVAPVFMDMVRPMVRSMLENSMSTTCADQVREGHRIAKRAASMLKRFRK